ncbi:GL20431 [Drosophila persimilis]|uniref:GL20431 n=1 Tax=Drosophila persimilis TaxID=7234 RepID=B4HBW8_DROPE|nr:GL20431 [Drosophila persimilis]
MSIHHNNNDLLELHCVRGGRLCTGGVKILTSQLQAAIITAPEAKALEPIALDRAVVCEEALDAVKTLPEFHGTQEQNVSWCQAAKAAYTLYEGYKVPPTNFRRQQGSNAGPLATTTIDNGHQQGAFKRPAGSQRFSDQRRPRVNHLAQEDPDQHEQQYEQLAQEAVTEIDEENDAGYDSDTVNFFEEESPAAVRSTNQ